MGYEKFDFLSRAGTFYKGLWYCRRLLKRAVLSGTASVSNAINMFEHRWLTGGGILSWGQSIIGIREVGLSRQANGT